MSEELEQSVPDVSGESSTPAESTSTEPAVSKEAAPEQEKYVPYDRFKELVEQRNEFSKKFEATEKELKEFRSRFEQQDKTSKGPSEEQKLIERLKGIDPEFGKWAEQQAARAAKLEALESWKAEADQKEAARNSENTRTQAVAMLDKLHTEHKLPKEFQAQFNARIAEIAQANPNLRLTDLPNIYKREIEPINKFLEAQKRSALSEYSTAKKTDAKVTTVAKGAKAPPPTDKSKQAKNPEELRAQMRAEMVAHLKANRNT